MSNSSSKTRATLHVPATSPETSMSLGTAWTDADWNSDGFCVNTAGYVWMTATGSSGDSTFSLLSSASDGQLLMQSLQRNLYIWGYSRTFVTAKNAILIAGAEGVKVLGGHGSGYEAFGIQPSFMKSTAVNTLAYDVGSDAVSTYLDRMDTVSTTWTLADLSLLGGQLVCDLLRLALGCRGVGTAAAVGVAVAGGTFAANVAAGAVDLAETGTDDVPGLHLHAIGGLDIVTPLFASFYSLAGMNFFSVMVSHVGWNDAVMIGAASASLKGSKTTEISGKDVEMVAGDDINIGSKNYDSKLYGKDIEIGSPEPSDILRQSATAKTTVQTTGTVDAYIQGPLAIDAPTTTEITGKNVILESKSSVTITSADYVVNIDKTKIEIVAASSTKVTIDEKCIEADCDGGMIFKVTDSLVALETSDAKSAVRVDSSGVATVEGGMITFK